MSGRSVVYRDRKGLWRWRHFAGNSRQDGASEQGYRRKWWAARKAHRAFPADRVDIEQ